MFESMFRKYFTPKNILFVIAVILFLVFMHKIADIAVMFFASFVIASSLNPIVDKFSHKYKRTIVSAVVLILAIILLLAFIVPVIIIAGHEIVNFAQSFPQYIDNLQKIAGNASYIKAIDISEVLSSAAGFTSNFINETINLGINIGSAFVYLIASLLIIYYFLADKEQVRNTFLKLVPSQMRKKAGEIWDSISHKIGGYVVAQIATMASVGIIVTLGLLLIKVDYALLLGLISMVLDIIPVIGPAIALVICLLVTFKAGPLTLILVAVIFISAQLVENNFVRPYVFGKFLDIHPLLIYFFLFLTAKYLGLIGVVFAPAIAATCVVLTEELYIKNI